MKDRMIGEIFALLDGTKLEVTEADPSQYEDVCIPCFFNADLDSEGNPTCPRMDALHMYHYCCGECLGGRRADAKDVYFKKI